MSNCYAGHPCKSAYQIFFESIKINNCWEWQGYKTKKGYGRIRWRADNNKRNCIAAHRLSYEIHKGNIPEGLTIDHLCRNRLCVNPDHLEAVTNKENILRGAGVCAENLRKTHCKRGHEYKKETVYLSKKGRCCKICRRVTISNYKKRTKQNASK